MSIENENCKFCQKKHSEFYTCYEHRLWRKVREELNKNPNRDIIFSVATMLGLCNANKKRGIKIERNLSPDLLPVRADIIQLEQVFINLINNARDALEGRANKTITISTQEQNGYIQVRFQDNGTGIAPEDLRKIFDAFFTTKQDKGGMGLGLYIAQDIIQSFSGTITVDSRVNEGTTFLIKLPITGKENAE